MSVEPEIIDHEDEEDVEFKEGGIDDDDILAEESDSEVDLLDDSNTDDGIIEEPDVDMDLLNESNTNEVDDITEETMDPKAKINYPRSKEWIEDITVPTGWRYKNCGRFILKSPKGNIFKSRRGAFAYMSSTGTFTRDELNEMKSSLKQEGWMVNKELPKNWMFRKSGDRSTTQFIAPGGELFETHIDAIRFVQRYAKYFSQEDVD